MCLGGASNWSVDKPPAGDTEAVAQRCSRLLKAVSMPKYSMHREIPDRTTAQNYTKAHSIPPRPFFSFSNSARICESARPKCCLRILQSVSRSQAISCCKAGSLRECCACDRRSTSAARVGWKNGGPPLMLPSSFGVTLFVNSAAEARGVQGERGAKEAGGEKEACLFEDTVVVDDRRP
ncbi:uncharacterized protein PV07_06219 [Cladophialophora immunda]|uniref:Uncharacterized protein n=1 Tax=Cladophialophora immunda TaxID=569365 RepID=A0A0D2AYX7_9EURO|nr:uncharacterized protein PV07_06219 [Cladophialophora immunda]KIW30477.1 hypothetical protein PV07_06219 [Cladophialophora immunda]